ncbi:flagellar export chaperone FliS [Pollutimonas thiosulfatoxidans]|uniref:Flagellar secretion chaperone FliS n=1 Tax=Pollutimonas thiosulfatoxidans TaxID=2028345 RepID=A0A410G9S0_9BURK|nr:flagellar export chaperone FliS [Pollutimonas thiosulfatoxidans]MBF6617776.1 flagellar export chaperone FliS [Candidimonas sp.]QAA92955.1 flagellar export chaperone FliS [Pollutimonas thiosulfatoxidans]
MSYPPSRGLRRQHSVQAYANIGLETEVLSASPEHLITLLFDGARAAIMKARLHMQNDNIEGRGMALSKAIDIVDSGLKASVDQETGGELAKNLIATYELIIRNLLLANLEADMQKLDLAERLLVDIATAWREAVDPLPLEAAIG